MGNTQCCVTSIVKSTSNTTANSILDEPRLSTRRLTNFNKNKDFM